MRKHKLAWTLIANLLLVMGLVSACANRGPGPAFLLSDLAETGVAGTQRARTLAVIVAATQATRDPTGTPQPIQSTSPASTPNRMQSAGPESACASGAPGIEMYIYPSEGFCFLYPSDFQARQPDTGIVDFVGPALGDSSAPVRAYISIQKQDPVGNRTLDEIMLDEWNQSRSPYRSYNIQLDGRDAVVAEGLVLGETGAQVMQIVFTHHDSVFTITFSPHENEEPYSPARVYIQRFWELAIPSFKFYQ